MAAKRPQQGTTRAAQPAKSRTHPSPAPMPTDADGRAKPPEPVRKDRPIKVRATQMGYYDHARRRVGDVFVIANEQAFSSRWMERVGANEPERTTTATQALRQQHDEIIASRTPGGEGVL